MGLIAPPRSEKRRQRPPGSLAQPSRGFGRN
jgi:hypothetical protein